MKTLFKKRPKPIKQHCNYLSNANGLMVELKLLETRMFYDTTWQVIVHKNGEEIANAKIVRQDDESMQNLDRKIRALEVISNETVLSLDEKSKIYYD